ncbi:type VI secretion system Vgr family protein [compost metagenome]
MLKGYAAQVLGQDVDLCFGFETEAASGAFAVLGFEGHEALSEGFEIAVDLVSNRSDLDLAALLDTSASLAISHKYDQPRFLHGVISEIERGGSGFSRTFYRAVLKPALHRLSYHSDSRIFQAQSAVDISRTVLGEHGIVDVEWRIDLPHQPREYCVQYAETSYDFLRRLWAEEGMTFFFAHSADGHRMIVTDAPQAMPVLEAAPQLTYNATPGGAVKGAWVSQFAQVERLRATHRVAADYSFKNPAYHQRQQAVERVSNGAKGRYELYQYPGRHKTPDAGKPFNDHALEAHRVDATTGAGETNAIQLSAGFIFALTDHPDPKANANHRLLRVEHRGQQPAALEEETPEGGATTYAARFTTQPAHLPYRPVNPNPRPRIDGPQIAHVTGPEGEEIYCDEHGRVRLWFPWDRHGRKDESSSCWVRVSQNWAGGNWGQMAIPRVGQEVVVEYLEGDPDQPIITGRTYHANNRPPYKLPEHKTKMVIRSDTHKGDGFNEISFEDEAGQENIALHAQKDQTLKVNHNRMKRVDNDQIESVGNNKSIEVGQNHQERIGGSMNLTVGGGGKGALFAALGGVMTQAVTDALDVAQEAGDPEIPTFLGGVVATTIGGEAASAPGISGFDGAGQNRQIAGAAQAAAGTALGTLLSSVMPVSGVKNTIVEKFVSDTVGLARTEQIGLFKNTMVGAVQNTTVGAKQFTRVGDEQRLHVGRIKTDEIGEEYTTHSGKRSAHSSGKLFQISAEERFEGTAKVWEIKAAERLLISAPGGYVEISEAGVKIRGLKVEIEGNAIDFRSGGPGEGSQCLRAMAASATPFVR